MLAATILEVVGGNKHDALRIFIHLVENVLPAHYYSENMRDLTVDLAVFKDLMKLKLPELSKHLEMIADRDEPPLVNVFTIQWFLTAFSQCLPKHLVLRIWDLLFLYGNEVLIRTALAIWDHFAE